MNLAAWVERNGRLHADRPALAVGDDVHADWTTFAARVAALAGGLRDRFALNPGDRVAIVMRNRPEYLEALFAIWHAGSVAVPVNARLHRDEIAYIARAQRGACRDRRRPRRRRRGRWSTPSRPSKPVSSRRASTGTSWPPTRRCRLVDRRRPTRRGCSTRAARPGDRRAPRSPTATC
jgi:hypothetical protein